jgi:hypothetical protein
LACQILDIVGSQIEIKRIFSIAEILTKLCKCQLGAQNLNQLVLISQNWPSDPHFGLGHDVECLDDFGDCEGNLLE